ncbi:uncharacterized protein LOC121047710 [Ixodes scapularis]|uniref:uncharacterized protein LOC121047710 n=1 Tax=Ixodes scapularis TaxID=6945 RepID=UPI001AD7140C|nr:uncharacterized protein LOC121047710 [Ixodes scapularis]
MRAQLMAEYERFLNNATIDKIMACHARRLFPEVKKDTNGNTVVDCKLPALGGHISKRIYDTQALRMRNAVTRMVGECIRRHSSVTEITKKYEDKLKTTYARSNAAAECTAKLFRHSAFKETH